MSRAIDNETKTKIYSVFKYYKAKKLDKSSKHRSFNVHNAVALATGVSSKTVERIAKLGKNLPIEGEFPPTIRENQKRVKRKTIRLEEIGESLIKNRIAQIYATEKDIPTVNKVRTVLREEGILKCGYEYMRLLLHKMGFKLQKNYIRAKSIKTQNVEFVECRQDFILPPKEEDSVSEIQLSTIKTEIKTEVQSDENDDTSHDNVGDQNESEEEDIHKEISLSTIKTEVQSDENDDSPHDNVGDQNESEEEDIHKEIPLSTIKTEVQSDENDDSSHDNVGDQNESEEEDFHKEIPLSTIKTEVQSDDNADISHDNVGDYNESGDNKNHSGNN